MRRIQIPWPLDNILNPESLRVYNQVLTLILQTRCAKYHINGAHFTKHRDEDPTRAVDSEVARLRQESTVFRMELLHFVGGLLNYLMTTVLHTERNRFVEAMSQARDAEAFIKVHEQSVTIVRDRFFLNERVLWGEVDLLLTTVTAF